MKIAVSGYLNHNVQKNVHFSLVYQLNTLITGVKYE